MFTLSEYFTVLKQNLFKTTYTICHLHHSKIIQTAVHKLLRNNGSYLKRIRSVSYVLNSNYKRLIEVVQKSIWLWYQSKVQKSDRLDQREELVLIGTTFNPREQDLQNFIKSTESSAFSKVEHFLVLIAIQV